MKSIHRIITVCTVLLISLAVVSSLFFLLTQNVQAKNVSAVNISGPIITNTTWTLANSPYILNGVVTVNEGVTLTVEPDVVVMANTNSGFDIAGRLEAIGTPSQPITFTSVASATPGEWYGIFIGGNNGMGSAHLNNAVVQYADWNFSIYSEEGAPITKIENTATRSSLYTGMEIYDSALHLVELDNVTFAHNGSSNRIILREFDGDFSLGGNTTLKTQPGLEGYQVDFWNNDWGYFVIPAGITLTVEPGVSLYMDRRGINVNGRLEAVGTPSQPITFTSIANSTPGEWNGIHILEEGNVHFNHAVVQYAVYNFGIHPEDSAPLSIIENSIIQFSDEIGMQISDHSLHLVRLENITFNEAGNNRIEIYNLSSLISSTTLTAQSGLQGYEVASGYLVIPVGVTLTVEPDVMLFMPESSSIELMGRLEAIGTPAQPITFTSVANSAPGQWGGISIDAMGSAHLNHTVVQYAMWNIGVRSTDGAPTTKIENTLLQFSEYIGMSISDHALHLVDLDNVTFANNATNRIEIEASSNSATLIDNATLTFQPGLEGYEVAFMNPVRGDFVVPSGITLTMEPGVTFFTPEWSYFRIQGHLEAIGTPSQPITFTSVTDSVPGGWEGIAVDEQGSAHLNHVVAEYGAFNIRVFTKDGAPVTKIENTITQFGEYIGMVISDYSLHLVDLDNVMFNNNGKNRISIEPWSDSSSLIGNATLTTQPGLEGYEVGDYRADTFDIPQGLTLTVEPGVSLYMGGGFINVNGRLQAIGTPSQPITFTSITTDTYPWQGIVVNGGSAELAHATINRSQQNGLSILNGSVSAICSTLINNLGSGIVVDENAQATVMLAYNSLTGNTVAGLRHEGSGWLDARYNWWGAADGPSGMGAGSGDAVTGNVIYDPWLTEPGCHDVASVNLEVTQSASFAIIIPAETLTYTITVTNHAAITATQVVLTDTLPANVTVLAAPANCIGITELVCALADLTDGEQISFTIQIRANLAETAVLTNTVEVLAYQPDLNLSLNRSVLTTFVQAEAPSWQVFLPVIINPD